MRGGAGIWLDWDAQNSRVTGNLIYDISTVQGAIFIEAAQARNLVDNNVMWNIDGEGVRLADSDDIVVAHNLFAHVSEEQIFAKVATDRDLNDRKLTSTGNQIVNNIFVDPGKPIASGDASNFADNNIYVSTLTGITAARDAGPHSLATFGRPNFNKQKLSLSWSSNSHLPNVPLVNGCDRDFFGHLRTPAHNIPGPFLNLNAQGIQNLMRENWKVPVNCDQLICSIN